mmetsp:Transcript_35983/g.85552  ORF Transcript_35983/g.85552 Transcript_35983/m.85552 type:complete len:503 (+) Transcript_35983:14-1522(+)
MGVMTRLPLLLSSSLLLLVCSTGVAAQEPCFEVLAQRFGGRASLSLGHPDNGVGICTGLILPRWHYGEKEEPALAGEGMAHIVTAEGNLVCAGAVVSKRVVLTAAGCADASSTVEVGEIRFVVSEVRVDPRGGLEGMALLILAETVPARPIPLEDGRELTRGSCNGVTFSLLTNATAEEDDEELSGDAIGAIPGNVTLCDQEEYHNLDVLCLTLADAGPRSLLGTPVLAVPQGAGAKGSRGAVLVGVVTHHAGAGLSIVSRVSAAAPWIRAAAGGDIGRFPSVKLVLKVTRFTGGARVLIHGGAYSNVSVSEDAIEHQDQEGGVTLREGCDAPVSLHDHGSGAILVQIVGGNSTEDHAPGGVGLSQSLDPPPSVDFEWREVGCVENFHGKRGVAACEEASQGGILGCRHLDVDGKEACISPECSIDLSWKKVGVLQKEGKAWMGGLTSLGSLRVAGRFGVWMCVRDWDHEQQLQCGIAHGQPACSDSTRNWVRGTSWGPTRR